MGQPKTQEIQSAKFFNGHRSKILHIFMVLADRNELANAKEIAKELQISVKAFEKLARFLQKNEFFVSTKGAHGGYKLSDEAKNITMLDILGFTILPDEEPHGIYEVMRKITDYYDTITLQDIIDWNE